MNINKLERRFGRFAIPNLSLVIIAAYILGYVLKFTASNALGLLYLDPYLIMHGQIWRLVSWLLIPPYELGIFTIINLFFFYSIGRTLEMMWGDFRYNLYIITGLIFVIIGMFAVYGIGCVTGVFGVLPGMEQPFSQLLSYYVSTYYINISVLLAFAMTIPDMEIRLWFVIPLKMKYLAYLEGVFLLIDFIGFNAIGRCVMIISLLNYVIFYITSRRGRGMTFSQARRRRQYRSATSGAKNGFHTVKPGDAASITRHKCAICGRTEKMDPSMMFRFCSKCNGNYEYCQEHLFTHKHIE